MTDRSPRDSSDRTPPDWSPHADLDRRVRRRKPRSPGLTAAARPHRVKTTLELHRIQVRLENDISEEAPLSEAEVDAEAALRLESQLLEVHPFTVREFDRIRPTLNRVKRDNINPLVEQAAVLGLPGARCLDDTLRAGARGRPSDRRLPMAVYWRMVLAGDRPEIRRHYRALRDPEHHSLQRAYGFPVHASSGQSESTVTRTLKAALERHDPHLAVRRNVEALQVLRSYGHPDIGRRLVVDGIRVSSPRPDVQSYSREHRRLNARGLSADVGRHGGEDRRDIVDHAWTWLVVSDMATTLPVAWTSFPFSNREFPNLVGLLDLLFRCWPDCPVEYVVADSEYDYGSLCWQLESRYGIHPCFPRRGNIDSAYPHAEDQGSPRCVNHGIMKLVQSEGFVERKRRAHLKLAPGEEANLRSARLRWRCEGCDARAITRPVDNPRLYTYLPFRGAHRRVGLRSALLLRRNGIESTFHSARARGAGHRGALSPKWVASDRQMQWLLGGVFLGETLRALAHESGAYERLAFASS